MVGNKLGEFISREIKQNPPQRAQQTSIK